MHEERSALGQGGPERAERRGTCGETRVPEGPPVAGSGDPGEARYRSLFAEMSVAMKVCELVRDERGRPIDFRVLEANPAFERDLGMPLAGLRGRLGSELFGVDPPYVAACAAVQETGVPLSIDARPPAVGKDFQVSIFRVDERTFAVAGIDVTEKRRAEADRERLLAEREELVRTISHDLRAPLTAISTHAQLLARAEPKRDSSRADAIAANARRMGEMIRDLVDTARSDAGVALSPVPLALGPFLAELLDRLDGGLDSARVRLVAPADLPAIRADPAKLERVFVNLLANALRHGAEDEAVEVTVAAGPGSVIVEVADHGPGIPAEDLPRLFDRFYRSRRARGEGLGLGLHIARCFVEAHGGAIEARSEEGRGATFRVTLPLADRE